MTWPFWSSSVKSGTVSPACTRWMSFAVSCEMSAAVDGPPSDNFWMLAIHESSLVTTKDDSWIASIQKLSEGGPSTAADISQLTAKDIQRVQAGETVPDFTLLDQNGHVIRLSDFRGQAVLLTFVYTRCPLPNFCPLMSKNFASLQERLEKEFPGKFQLLSVSIDPQFDRPEILKQYAAR